MADECLKTILIVGAGASFGARSNGFPDPNAPPLGCDLAGYLLRWLEENDPTKLDHIQQIEAEIERSVEYPSSDIWDLDHIEALKRALEEMHRDGNFEARINQMFVDGNNWGLLADLNVVVATALLGGKACPFLPHADRYDALLERIGTSLVGAITPNYDLLLEQALERAHTSFRYPVMQPRKEEGLPIFKIHGSANFLQVKQHGHSANEEIARQQTRPTRFVDQEGVELSVETELVYVPEGHDNLWIHLKDFVRHPPIIATYAQGKPSTHDRSRLDQIRKLAIEFVRAKADANVLLLGLRPPNGPDDDACWHELCEAAAKSTGKRIYVSPSEAECATMSARFETWHATFEKFLEDPRAPWRD